MIIIINGPLGAGKTETSDAVLELFDRGVMLDGDYFGAVKPFDLYDYGRIEHLYQTLRHVIAFQKEYGYSNFVINYVFESPDTLKRLKDILFDLDDRIYSFRLICDLAEIQRRIQTRSQYPERLAWEIDRAAQLVEIQEKASKLGDLGYPIETTHLSAVETARLIWDTIHERVILLPYDPAWVESFEMEKARLQAALEDIPLAIKHIGSTAVVGLYAKPVIDILLVVPELEVARQCVPPLQALGYQFIDHPENRDRRFFRKGSPRTHHLHIVAQGTPAMTDPIDFRNALRANAALRDAYGRLKLDLAQRYPDQRATYTEQKTAFVEAALKSWRKKQIKSGPTAPAAGPDSQ